MAEDLTGPRRLARPVQAQVLGQGDLIAQQDKRRPARKTYRLLGHHDATHGHIAISRSLDSADVPLFVVESVVYHEMLHIAHPTKHVNGRRYNHTAAFRRDERKYTQLSDAERWIERNVRKLKKAAKRQ